MEFVFWTKTLFLLTVPAFLLVSFVTLRKMQRESGKSPAYWVGVHTAGLGVFMGAAFAESHRIANGIYIDLLLFVVYWAVAIKICLSWWKARSTRPEPPAQPD
jgi:hypothetical protein